MGIPISDRPSMAKRYYTSKIEKFEDLDSVSSYGFRGEALNSICSACQLVQITTKTIEDPTSIIYDVDKTGTIISSKSVGGEQGTTVNALKLFQYFPVRRQVAQKTVNNAIKRIMDCLMSYALIHPNIRLSFKNMEMNSKKRGANKKEWIKISTKSIMDSITAVFGKELTTQLQYKTDENIDTNDDSTKIVLEAVLPKRDSDSAIVCKGDRTYFYINERPVSSNKGEIKQIFGKIRDKYNSVTAAQGDASSGSRKSPFVLFHLKLPLGSFDVNVEPSKNVVLLHRPEVILQMVDDFLEEFYSEPLPTSPQPLENQDITSSTSVSTSPKPSLRTPTQPADQENTEQSLVREKELNLTSDRKSNEIDPKSCPNSVETNRVTEDPTSLIGSSEESPNNRSVNERNTADDKLGFLPNKLIAREDWSKGHVDGLRNPVLVCNTNTNLEGDESGSPEISRNHGESSNPQVRTSLRLGEYSGSKKSNGLNYSASSNTDQSGHPSSSRNNLDDLSKPLSNTSFSKPDFATNPFVSHYSTANPASPFTQKLNSSISEEVDLDEELSPEKLKNSSVTFNEDLNRTGTNGPTFNPKFTPSSRHYPIFDPEHRKQLLDTEVTLYSDEEGSEPSSAKRKSIVTTTLTPTKRFKPRFNPFERLVDSNQLTLHEMLKSPSSCRKLGRSRVLGMVDTLSEELSQNFDSSATIRKYRTIRNKWEKKSTQDSDELLPQPLYRFIGNADQFWIVKNENNLVAVDPIRAQYPHIYSKLMESYEFSLTPLENPILVSPK
ncbi:hypothetical protein K7432_005394 [Basidiobolus ranarum]|uniref:DNA mismatch repair protein S5 domain-containing protein n=1 Tax=Basidiobolus ranarum TaxID=34480 RepID=A0ABR2W3F0_9FUNG